MAGDPPPLLGFNNNVRHRGRVFHIQTEDSGVRHPRIVTHLFADGGRIVRSARTDYAEHLGRDDMTTVVRRLMKEQHKAMFVSLRAGEFDALIERACGDSPPASVTLDPSPVEAAPPPEPEPEPDEAPAAPEAPRPPAQRRRLSNPFLMKVAAPPPPGDVESAERALEAALAQAAASLPEPSVPAVSTVGAPYPRRRGTPALGTPAVQAAEPAAARGEGAKYAASRPATIFAEPPRPESATIFGGDVASQSLDDVILNFLAEDLAPDE
ncbi:MAG: hypothetical protein IT376_14255 [Polyangiaceae bacterium]|nr:hypothetical protein [Polyangiaceae bacterium]